MKNNNALFYTCSLIEFISRKQKLKRRDTVNFLGKEAISKIYNYSDVFHCEVIDSVADRFIQMKDIPQGDFDNVSACKYDVPDYWDIGEVYERLIEDIQKNDEPDEIIETLFAVYNSWISDSISNFNSDFFYQSRQYIKECFVQNKMIA